MQIPSSFYKRKSREVQPIKWKLPSCEISALPAPQALELITHTTVATSAATATTTTRAKRTAKWKKVAENIRKFNKF